MNWVLNDKNFIAAFQNRTIKVVAPSSGTTAEKIKALKTLHQLKIDIPEDILYSSSGIPYHSNSDEKRFEQLKAALLNESENSIIWILRGGYGSARLLDELDKLPIPKHQKVFIGFSDVTALHLFLSQKWGWKTIHGAGISQLVDKKWAVDNFLKIAEMIHNPTQSPLFLNDLKPLNLLASKAENNALHGQLTGGNLTIFESSIGTRWQAKTADKIVFLEEIGEKGYRIDRSLYHCYQAGIFDKVKAVILGQFQLPDDQTISIALHRFADEMNQKNISVFKSEQFGHGSTNYPLVYKAEAVIEGNNLIAYNQDI